LQYALNQGLINILFTVDIACTNVHYTNNINENRRKVCLFKMFVGYNKSQIKGTAGTTCTAPRKDIINSKTSKVYRLASYLHNSTYNNNCRTLPSTYHTSAKIINTDDHSACMFRDTDYSTPYLSLIHAALPLICVFVYDVYRIVSRSYPCKHPSVCFLGLHTDIRRRVLFPASGSHNLIKVHTATNLNLTNTYTTVMCTNYY